MKKKFIVLFLIMLFCLVSNKTVKAASKPIYNLIDINQISYNNERDAFYSQQQIQLSKDERYTLVVSRNFLGSVYVSESNALSNDEFGTIFTNLNNDALDMDLILIPSNSGLYYSSFSTTEDCNLVITDFITKGYSLETLPKKEIILYQGVKEDFQGFREAEYLEDYVRVDNSINLYTSYNNLINTSDITSKIKCYDNNKGFYNNLVLVEDNYQNSSELGSYSVIYKTTDDSNNESILTVNIHVVDNVAPVINGPDVIEWDCYDLAPVPEVIIKEYSAYDEVDGNLTYKIRAPRTNLHMYNIGVPRDYELYLEVSDYSGNKCEKKVIISAKDITAPVLKTEDVTLNLSQLGQCAFGDFFGTAIVEVSDNSSNYIVLYEANEVINSIGFSGEYQLKIIVRDYTGNETMSVVSFKVVDDIGPEFYMQTHLFNTTTAEVKDVSDIKSVIADNLNEQGILFDSIDLISCNYFSNETTAGTYEVKYAYSYKGETNFMVGTITVEEAPTNTYGWIIFVVLAALLLLVVVIRRRRRVL